MMDRSVSPRRQEMRAVLALPGAVASSATPRKTSWAPADSKRTSTVRAEATVADATILIVLGVVAVLLRSRRARRGHPP
jgi:hypothetical protein